jgi:hypothetical protein
MSKVEDTDLGLNRIIVTLKEELSDVVIKVGVQAKDKTVKRGKGGSIRNTDQPLAAIAAIHEFGLGGMPQRSFLRSAFDENKPMINKMGDHIVNSAIKGISTETALDQLGNVVQGMVQKKIVDGPFVPNSPATIKRKKSSKPLIDTGHLRQSIRYVIERKGANHE